MAWARNRFLRDASYASGEGRLFDQRELSASGREPGSLEAVSRYQPSVRSRKSRWYAKRPPATMAGELSAPSPPVNITPSASPVPIHVADR
ncbi:uncharacterized protein THITE_2110853 [Thermothielavioides terrestris NRRL 8126]|uniref:Uncharacterized protein n=1 Tax=Thermothielavioides terrestris (strain ATCC 38088 / NRRL 8126) TaxID=578455 RepID=G2QUL8_THETT|nr:uncharacterized protein THITE_2110853 [Thermothielavioides terrestris NRRL 8126]AEO64573.1 hypothetical protein THITE_2110853 [Thermothielavioides terrestris NRRL 8126]